MVVLLLRRRQSAASILLLLLLLTLLFFWAESNAAHSHHQPTNNGPFRRSLRLAGPGSSPPSCRSKCGPCTPCKPVHVPIQPGFSFPLEYYPEAWRCKCGTKLFMP